MGGKKQERELAGGDKKKKKKIAKRLEMTAPRLASPSGPLDFYVILKFPIMMMLKQRC